MGELAITGVDGMITCFLQYQIRAEKLAEFEEYARRWMQLVEAFGGEHHGYYVTHEGASDVAVALFSFESLRAYENYRNESAVHADCIATYALAAKSGCIKRYDRQFLRPVRVAE